MKKTITFCLAVLLLFGCAAQDAQPTETEPLQIQESTSPPESEATEPSTEPETEPTEPTQPEQEEPEPIAERITSDVAVYFNTANHTYKLADSDRYSIAYRGTGVSLAAESETPFSALYIEWDQVPGNYTLTWDGGSLECGTEKYLHDYIRLPEAVTRVEFQFETDTMKQLCTLHFYTAGAAPEGIQDWDAPLETADILVFPTHSDDDVLFFGPVIAYYLTERNASIQLCFMVDHGKSYRDHERLDGMWAMGLRNYPVPHTAPDAGVIAFESALNYYGDDEILPWQIEQIRRFKPLVILGHDPDGEYGNGGHIINTYYLMQAVELATDLEMYPESAETYGVWNTPKVYLHLYQENSWYFDVDAVMPSDPQGRTPYQVAYDAFKCHVSQGLHGLQVSKSESNPDWDCRPFGLYRTLVGYDTTADILENIVSEDWR